MFCQVFVFNFFLLLLPLTASGSAAFSSVASICTMGYQVSYAIPIICKFTFRQDEDMFSRVYFTLGSMSGLCGVVSSFWLLLSSFIILLPTQSPITPTNMNYSAFVAVVFVVVGHLSWCYHGKTHMQNALVPTRFSLLSHESEK